MKKLYLLLLILCVSLVRVSAEDIKVTYTDAQGKWEFTILTQRNEETGQDVPYAARVDKVEDYIVDDISIPTVATYEGVDYPVEQIGEYLFNGNRTVGSIVLPITVKSIGRNAFGGCSSLKEVKNTSNCESIGYEAFSGCGNITGVDLSSCKRVDHYAFRNCSKLQDVGSVAKIETIGYESFSGCGSLVITDSLANIKTIDGYAFQGCSSITQIDMPAGVVIGDHAFNECKNLVKIGTLDDASIGSWAFRYCEALKTVDVSKAKSIGEWAFENCSSMESVGDLSAFTSLENHVFVGCSSLKELNLSSCKSIALAAFEYCSSLSKVTLGACTTIDGYAFNGTAIQNIDLSTVKLLGDNAFRNCSKLESIGSLSNLKIIEGETFIGCSSLEEIDVTNIVSIGANAFNGCSSLKKVDGFGHFTEVPEGLFSGCQSLETIDLSKVESVGNEAFMGCNSLKEVDLPVCVTLGRATFMNCSALELIQLPLITSLSDAYYDGGIRSAFGGCNSLKEIIIPSCTTIGSYTFNNCSSLESIKLPKVEIIKDNAFRGCTGMISVDSLKVCESIGASAFQDCSLLNIIDLSKVESVGNEAFMGCNSLKNISLPVCTTIGSAAFMNCAALESINMPLIISLPGSYYEDDRSWDERYFRSTFLGCNLLKDVNIPSCKNIGSSAFYNCSSLESVKLPKVETINENAFRGCTGLVSVDSLKICQSIGASAFQDCSSLNNIDLSKIITIGGGAFYNCSSLTTIDLTACQTLGSNVFSGCTKLVKVDGFGHFTEVPAGMFKGLQYLESIDLSKIESIGNNAFEGCSSLTVLDLAVCKTLGTNVFSGCSSLKKIEGFTNITKIPDGLFNGMQSLESINLAKVDSIGSDAFRNCISLKELDLTNCKKIGNGAFYGCKGIKNLNLPACETIGNITFINCDSLETINMPLVTTLPDGNYENSTFYGCKALKEVKMPSCTTIGKYSFMNCLELTSIGTLSSIENINENAFYGCSQLGDLIIESANLKSIGNHAFNHTGNITLMGTSPATINASTFGEYILILVPAEALETYQAANGWYDIRNRIFSIGDKFDYDISVTAKDNGSGIYDVLGEDDLRKVVTLKMAGTINSYDIMIMRDKMPNLHYLDMSGTSVLASSYEYVTGHKTQNDTLGTSSFSGLSKLVSVKLPKTLKYIGEAFKNCGNLKSVEFYEGLEAIGGWAFYECTNLKDVVLPKGLKRIYDHGFARCYSLQKIVLPEGLVSLDYRAFEYNNSLTDVTFPSTLETIGDGAFYDCKALPGIKLPKRLTIIGSEAFESCSSLKELNIPSSVQEIRSRAFSGCGLKKVYTYTVLPTKIDQGTFSNYENAILYIPDFSDSKNNYYWATGWSQFSKLLPFDKSIDYDYFYLNDDYTLDEDRIEGNPDADLNPGSGLTVEGSDTQNLNDVTVTNNNNIWGSIIADSNISANLLKFNIQVQGNKWYFFSFPYDVKMSNIDCQSQFIFRYYDGEARAANGSGGWKNLDKGSDVLKRGEGYIFQCSANSVLKITIETPSFEAEDFKQALSSYVSDNAQDAGWNFVGNPYTSYFDLNDTKYSAPITVWNQNTNSYEALRPGDDDYNFHPFQAFFVQKPDDTAEIDFGAEFRTTYTKAEQKNAESKARRLTRGIDENRQLVELTIAGDGATEASDKTRIVFNEEAKVSYEIGCDAAKFISTADVPQIYSVDNEGNMYAINERPLGDVKIAYQAKKAGTYKIAAKRMDREVVLYDDETKTEFDFSTGDYTFESEVGTFENRFILKAPSGSPTGLGDIKKQTGVSVMGCADGLYINNVGSAQVEIYSMSGVLLATNVGDGMVTLPKATYIIKVNNISTKVLVR